MSPSETATGNYSVGLADGSGHIEVYAMEDGIELYVEHGGDSVDLVLGSAEAAALVALLSNRLAQRIAGAEGPALRSMTLSAR